LQNNDERREHVSTRSELRKPLVLRHNHDDLLIPARYHSVYPAMVQSAYGRAPTVLPPAGEGACRFTLEQIMQACRRAGIEPEAS
jgi:hypothetical protein